MLQGVKSAPVKTQPAAPAPTPGKSTYAEVTGRAPSVATQTRVWLAVFRVGGVRGFL